jgi:hypothetical protein
MIFFGSNVRIEKFCFAEVGCLEGAIIAAAEHLMRVKRLVDNAVDGSAVGSEAAHAIIGTLTIILQMI